MRYFLVIVLFIITSYCYAQSNWILQNSNTSYNLTSVYFNNGNVGWVVGYNGEILKTTDGGIQWNEVSSGTTNKLNSVVFFSDDQNGWIVGEFGTILHTSNGGNSWVNQNSGIINWLGSVYFTDLNNGYVCGKEGTILKTSDGGNNWVIVTTPTTEDLHSIYFINNNIGWAVGFNGLIIKTTDGGQNWVVQISNTLQELNSVYFINENVGWICGNNGEILYTSNGGTLWSVQNSTTTYDLNNIKFSDELNGITVGSNGVMLRTNDGGANWNSENSGVTYNLCSSTIINLNSCWVVGDIGTIISKSIGIKVDLQETNVSTQNPIELNVKVQEVNNLFGASIKIKFDNSIVSLDSIKQGDFLINNTGGEDVTLRYYPQNFSEVDSIIIDQSILGKIPVSGSGTLIKLYFTAKASGSSDITLNEVKLRDNYNQVINTNITNGVINILVPVVNLKVFLEGPYTTNSMSIYLNSLGLIPLNQPYGASPWNYNGSESVASGFFSTHTNIVDWVLIQLRTGISASTTVATRAAFINSDGVVVDLDGVSPVSFFVNSDTEYYVVIEHRNHLSVMSALPFQINESTPLYNFTNAQNKAYGTNSMILLPDGYYGMIAGDANGNGQVQNNDVESYWKLQNGQSGYREADFNLNGQVQNNDRETFWKVNNGKGSQVPN